MKSAYNQIVTAEFAVILNAESIWAHTDATLINKCAWAEWTTVTYRIKKQHMVRLKHLIITFIKLETCKTHYTQMIECFYN